MESRLRSWYEALVYGGRWSRARRRRGSASSACAFPRSSATCTRRACRHPGGRGHRAADQRHLRLHRRAAAAPFGAEIFTVDLVAIGVLRELGVLLTAIMVAGRTGSAYAAELGVMKLNDEVDALESMGLNPTRCWCCRRVLALVLVMPLLTIVADAAGLVGGAFLTSYLLDLPWSQFVMRLDAAIAPRRSGPASSRRRCSAADRAHRDPARSAGARVLARARPPHDGRRVQSIFLVIFADALFAIFFLEIDF